MWGTIRAERGNLGKVFLSLLNWCAPCTISSESMQLQSQVLSHVHHMQEGNIGLVLSPCFTYKYGSLWSTEESCMRLLSKGNVTFDNSFSLLFEKKVDERDSRPLAYHGRIVMNKKSCWKDSQLVTKAFTEPAQQLAAKDMSLVEDLSDHALPTSIDDSTAATVQVDGG